MTQNSDFISTFRGVIFLNNHADMDCCNVCGKELDLWDKQEDFTIHKNLGYGTKYDGDILKLKICCECMNHIVETCAQSPIITD